MVIDQLEMFVIAPNSPTLSADAIAIRYGEDLTDRSLTTVVVVDSGRSQSTSGKVQDIVNTVFKTDTVDLIVSTHADQDHAGGIPYLLNNLTVGQVWVHRPQDHHLANQEPITASMTDIRDILTTATKRGVPVNEPFSDSLEHEFEGLHILGPSSAYYENLMRRGMFEEEELELLKELNDSVQASMGDGAPGLRTAPTTSLRNNSSTVLLLKLQSVQLLLTGDAGVEAFESARPNFEGVGYDPTRSIIQLPHHGSRNNLNPETSRLLLGSGSQETRAFVSAAREDRYGFPHIEVTDEFIRAGRKIPRPAGKHLRYAQNCPHDRPDEYQPVAEDRYIRPSWEPD